MMRDRLEFKILGIGISILIIGISAASLALLYVQKNTIYMLAEERLGSTAEVITRNIERAMLEASAKVAEEQVNDLKSVGGVEGIELYNWEGKEAFKPEGAVKEAEALSKISAAKASFTVRAKEILTFYKPLDNKAQCQGCHGSDKPILGAVKISISLKKEYETLRNFILFILAGSFFGLAVLGFFFWQILRKMVITPVKTLETAAKNMADGDLSFKTNINTTDEIGKLERSIKESLYSISGIIQRVKDISKRIAKASEEVEKDSGKVVEGTQVEAEAIANISSSVEELNAAMTEIAESTEGLASSVEETAASVEEMTTSIENVAGVTHELSSGVEATSSSIEQLSATLKEVARNAGELAEVSEETISAIEEIISSVKEVELSAKESAKLSEKATAEASTLGATSINKTVDGMHKIKMSVETTGDAIKKLGGRSEDIGKILNVIDEITDQTTLLALNAAILAAQAGERGKGFSVVADEIKDLAERTAFSTQEISALIQSVQQEVKDAINSMKDVLKSVDEGISLSKEAGDSFKKILESSRKSSEMAFSIESSTAEQAKAARYMSEAVEKVRAMVGQIAKATSEQFKGITLVMKATEKMRDASHQVATATNEQAASSRQISQAIEMISDKSQHISIALNEQKMGSNQIFRSTESIKSIPKENRDTSFSINRTLRTLQKDADFMSAEIERFRLYEDKGISVIRMGVVPLTSPSDMFRKFTPLVNYLSGKLGRKIELKVASDFESAVNEIGEGATQLCFMTPSTYIDAHRKYGVELLVKALREGKPYQHSVIITKLDSTIKSVKDIKGRSFAFGDINSTSSHIVPRAMLLDEGIDLKDLSSYNYLGHHDDVVRAVLKDEFDAGAVMESAAYKFKDQGLKLLAFSEEIPEFNICVGSTLSEADANTIKSALLALKESTAEGSAILKSMDKSYTGFMDTTDEDYNNIRLIMSKIGLL